MITNTSTNCMKRVDDMDRACTISQAALLLYSLGKKDQSYDLISVEEYTGEMSKEQWFEQADIVLARKAEMEASYEAHAKSMARD